MSERFVPPSLDGFKRKVKYLRSLVGKDSLPVNRAYEVTARVCGYPNWYALNQLFKSPTPQLTIWDEDLDGSELMWRREVQVSILMEEAGVTKSEAEHILDVVRISSRVRRDAAASEADADVNARVDAMTDEYVEPKTQPVPLVTYRKRRTLVSKALS
ncbi:hypothetical protein J4761_04155 [Burkholderia pseudomallei]|uniref:hypothetical protein n=1 Tax=Burkholderia pseudomallei TaxID=28450 RepID=UPI001AAF0662|nr:hypothetical protein [Burkholderia pseudomallei]